MSLKSIGIDFTLSYVLKTEESHFYLVSHLFSVRSFLVFQREVSFRHPCEVTLLYNESPVLYNDKKKTKVCHIQNLF